MEIRRLTGADVAAFRAVRSRALHEVPEAFNASADDFDARSDADIALMVGDDQTPPGNLVLGAFLDGQLVGLAGLRREMRTNVRHKAKLWTMYVAPEARGRGVGQGLVERAIAIAREIEDLEQIVLDVTPEMTSARNLYLHLGFTVYGREPRALKLPERYYDNENMILLL
jgi:ribosomal protein S18 acetylase RimI-like enzyme